MKQIKTVAVILAIFGTAFLACKKEKSIVEKKGISVNSVADTSNPIDPDSLGYYHNEMVTYVIDDFINSALNEVEALAIVGDEQQNKQVLYDKITDLLASHLENFYAQRGVTRLKSDILNDFSSLDINDIVNTENSNVFNGYSGAFLTAVNDIDVKCSDYMNGTISESVLLQDILNIYNASGVPTSEQQSLYAYAIVASKTHPLWHDNAEEWTDDLSEVSTGIIIWLNPLEIKNSMWGKLWGAVPKADKQGAVAGSIAGGPAGALEGAALGSLVDALWP